MGIRTWGAVALWVIVYLAPQEAMGLTVPVSRQGSCFFGEVCYATGRFSAVTTADAPYAEWEISPEFPGEPSEWRVVWFSILLNGNARYSFSYSDSTMFGGASLDSATFLDHTGRALASVSAGLAGDCGFVGGAWTCSDSNLLGGQTVGCYSTTGQPCPPSNVTPDPNMPSLDGPMTLRVSWELFGDFPDSGEMAVADVSVGYAVEPVPEPNTALLVMIGLCLLRAHRPSGIR